MIVLLSHDADAAAVARILARARDLNLTLVPLDGGRGRGYEVVGEDRGRALQLLGTPGVGQVLTRRTALSGGEPLWPHFALRVGILALVLVSALAVLAVAFPPPLGEPVGTPDAAPAPLEWFLRPPAAAFDALPLAGPLVLALLWLAVWVWPFLDRRELRSSRTAAAARRALALAILAAIAVAVVSGPAAAQEAPPAFLASSCATACHGEPRTELLASVHAHVLACTDCHGGDPQAQRDKAASHAPEAGYRGTPARRDVPELCASCHSDPRRMHAYALPTDQLAHYRTSSHGQALFERGETAVAVCTDCHGTHDIRRAADPQAPTAPARQPETCGRCHADERLMARFGLPTDIVERFEQGVHGEALLVARTRGAPACASCHGAHGATPPGTADIVQVCAHCHPRTGEAFRASPHFDADGMRCGACHADRSGEPGFRRAGCAACHGAHGIAAAGDDRYHGDAVGTCGHCHRGDDGARAVADSVLDGRRRLQDAMAATLDELAKARQAGVFLEAEAVRLREARSALVALQPLAHTLDRAAIEAAVADGLERQQVTHEEIAGKRRVLRDRRILVAGLVVVLLMLAGLMGSKLAAVRRLS